MRARVRALVSPQFISVRDRVLFSMHAAAEKAHTACLWRSNKCLRAHVHGGVDEPVEGSGALVYQRSLRLDHGTHAVVHGEAAPELLVLPTQLNVVHQCATRTA